MLVMRRSSSLRWLQFTVKIDLLGEVYATPTVFTKLFLYVCQTGLFHCFKFSFIYLCRSESLPNQPKTCLWAIFPSVENDKERVCNALWFILFQNAIHRLKPRKDLCTFFFAPELASHQNNFFRVFTFLDKHFPTIHIFLHSSDNRNKTLKWF